MVAPPSLVSCHWTVSEFLVEAVLVGAAEIVATLAKTKVFRIEYGPAPFADLALILYWTSAVALKPVSVYVRALMSVIVVASDQALSG